jgi:hypothetical protein
MQEMRKGFQLGMMGKEILSGSRLKLKVYVKMNFEEFYGNHFF